MTETALESPGFAVRPRWTGWPVPRRPGGLTLSAVVIALLVSLPVLGVAASLMAPAGFGALSRMPLESYALNTLWMMTGVGLITAVAGAGTAWLVVMCRFPGRRILEWALILPLAAPAYVLAYAYTDFLQHAGPVQTWLREVTGWGPRAYWFPEIRSLGGAVLVFASVFFPYVYLLSRAAFLNQSACMLEVGRSLGAGPWALFTRVGLPLARPALAAGVALALMETLADFGTVSHFGVQTFTTGIYKAWFSHGDRMLAAQLSSMLLGVALLLLMLEKINRAGRGFEDGRARFSQLPRYRLGARDSVLAIGACLLPLTLGFLLPVGILVSLAMQAGHNVLAPRYLTLATNSFTLAGLAAGAAVLLALVLAYAHRMRPTAATCAAVHVAALGYAVPGSVIAVGILIPLAGFDNALDAMMRDLVGISTGLVFTGSIAALLYAYLVRFMTVSVQTVDSSLTQITPNMDAAARSLGASPPRALMQVHVPIIRGGVLTAALIVFVDVMKELPATLIVRPFNFDTLAIQAYRLASDERLAEASTASLAIVAVGLLPIILLSRTIMRSRPGH
ncbi:MAG: ABC transporter permease [Alphaproteobacteria bacterium]